MLCRAQGALEFVVTVAFAVALLAVAAAAVKDGATTHGLSASTASSSWSRLGVTHDTIAHTPRRTHRVCGPK